MRFHLPVKVGDEVSLYANVAKRGRTSMHIHVTAWRRSRHDDVSPKVTGTPLTGMDSRSTESL